MRCLAGRSARNTRSRLFNRHEAMHYSSLYRGTDDAFYLDRSARYCSLTIYRHLFLLGRSGVVNLATALIEKLLGVPSMIDAELEIARNLFPIAKIGTNAAVTQYADVVDVLMRDKDFATDYNAKLNVIMGGQPFF